MEGRLYGNGYELPIKDDKRDDRDGDFCFRESWYDGSGSQRFLEQATWGPTPELIAHVKAIGKEAFLDEQFAMNVSTYPDPTATPDSSSLTPARNQFFFNAFHLDDQLRQRVAFALGQLFVVSANTVGADYQMVPYLRLLT